MMAAIRFNPSAEKPEHFSKACAGDAGASPLSRRSASKKGTALVVPTSPSVSIPKRRLDAICGFPFIASMASKISCVSSSFVSLWSLAKFLIASNFMFPCTYARMRFVITFTSSFISSGVRAIAAHAARQQSNPKVFFISFSFHPYNPGGKSHAEPQRAQCT